MITNDLSRTIGTASTAILKENKKRLWATFVNDGATSIYLSFDRSPGINKGICLEANGGAFLMDSSNLWDGDVYGISSVACHLCVIEVSSG